MTMSWTNISDDSQQQAIQYTDSQPLINPQVLRRFQLICYGIIGEGLAVFGIVTNIINIICFVKQGFKDSINISLLSLAISDLGCLITILWTNVVLVPEFQELDLPFHAMDTMYFISSMPHVVFTRTTAVITAFITLERCLCITMPLKVSKIFTAKRIVIINACNYFVLILSAVPIYASARFAVKFYPQQNKTLVGLVFTKDRFILEKISLTFNSVIVPFVALFIIVVGMVTMVTTLQKQAKWRQTQQTTKGLTTSSERDQKLVKMIMMISILFVVCFCPSAILFIGIALEPKFSYRGEYSDITVFVYAFSNIAETMNSSMNIFIYYKMSTKFRNKFRHICYEKENKMKA